MLGAEHCNFLRSVPFRGPGLAAEANRFAFVLTLSQSAPQAKPSSRRTQMTQEEKLLSCVRALVYDFLRTDPRFGRAVANVFYTEAVVVHRETLATVSFAKRFLSNRNLTLEDALRQVPTAAVRRPLLVTAASTSSTPDAAKGTTAPLVAAVSAGNQRVRSATAPPPFPAAGTAPARAAALPDSDDDDVPAPPARKPFNSSRSDVATNLVGLPVAPRGRMEEFDDHANQGLVGWRLAQPMTQQVNDKQAGILAAVHHGVTTVRNLAKLPTPTASVVDLVDREGPWLTDTRQKGKLYIRNNEYGRLWGVIDGLLNEPDGGNLLLLGNPGIGKSMSFNYITMRCLADRPAVTVAVIGVDASCC